MIDHPSIPQDWPSVAGLLLIAIFIRYLIIRSRRLDLPFLNRSEFQSDRTLLVEADLKYPDTPYILPAEPPVVILPTSMLEEVRNVPENQASFTKVLKETFHYEYTGVGDHRPEIIAVIKSDLTKNLPNIVSVLQDETRYGFDKELGPCNQWTTIKLYPKLVRMIALLSGRIFVGFPLSRHDEWITSSVQYTLDCEGARRAVLKYPSFMRKMVIPFLPEMKRLLYHKIKGGKLLEPLFKVCVEKHDKEKVTSTDFQTEQGSLMSWLLNHADDISQVTQLGMANDQMMLSFAAIHTTTSSACHALYDLMAHPEYIQPLREEIEQLMADEGHEFSEDGSVRMKKKSLAKLKKLDSFLKESQRMKPLGLVNMVRICTSPLTLSSGLTLPTGTRFAFNLHVVNFSPQTPTFSPVHNPPSYKPPHEFDGFRFSKLRTMEGNENRHQFVTTSPESFAFGYGNHACPGRFFASSEIKIVLIELLRHWEFRLKGDVEGKGGEENRPANYEYRFGVSPNTEAEVEFGRRKM